MNTTKTRLLNFEEFKSAVTIALATNQDIPEMNDVDYDVLNQFYGDLAERGIDNDEAPDRWFEWCEANQITDEQELWDWYKEAEKVSDQRRSIWAKAIVAKQEAELTEKIRKQLEEENGVKA